MSTRNSVKRRRATGREKRARIDMVKRSIAAGNSSYRQVCRCLMQAYGISRRQATRYWVFAWEELTREGLAERSTCTRGDQGLLCSGYAVL